MSPDERTSEEKLAILWDWREKFTTDCRQFREEQSDVILFVHEDLKGDISSLQKLFSSIDRKLAKSAGANEARKGIREGWKWIVGILVVLAAAFLGGWAASLFVGP
jgi:hypothetical protein